MIQRLRRGGATVLATARNIPTGGGREQFIEADVSTRAGADHIIKTTFDRLGGLDILINSVGGSSAPGGGVLALTDENLAARVRVEFVFRSALGPWLSSSNAEATLRSHYPCLVHSANSSVA
jgi:NAD(P)-dependent dehydrogenase (short-subunit alcohol dehydrogenase family)